MGAPLRKGNFSSVVCLLLSSSSLSCFHLLIRLLLSLSLPLPHFFSLFFLTFTLPPLSLTNSLSFLSLPFTLFTLFFSVFHSEVNHLYYISHKFIFSFVVRSKTNFFFFFFFFFKSRHARRHLIHKTHFCCCNRLNILKLSKREIE